MTALSLAATFAKSATVEKHPPVGFSQPHSVGSENSFSGIRCLMLNAKKTKQH